MVNKAIILGTWFISPLVWRLTIKVIAWTEITGKDTSSFSLSLRGGFGLVSSQAWMGRTVRDAVALGRLSDLLAKVDPQKQTYFMITRKPL